MTTNVNLQRLALVLAIGGVTVLLDQVTKMLALELLPAETIHLAGDLVRLHLSRNPGAFLGLGSTLSPELRFWIFTFASLFMVIAVMIYAATLPDLRPGVVIALAFLAGGGLGNLIDRMFREGYVVDFLNFGIGGLRTGILNVADIAITFGAIYVVLMSLFESLQGGT